MAREVGMRGGLCGGRRALALTSDSEQALILVAATGSRIRKTLPCLGQKLPIIAVRLQG